MKRFIALLLTSILLVAMFAVPASAAEKNLAFGKNYTISLANGSTTTTPHGDWNGSLTDGAAFEALDDTIWSNGGNSTWFGLNKANVTSDNYAYITIDLGSVCNVSTVKIHCANHSGWGIPNFAEMYVLTSEDGKSFKATAEKVVPTEGDKAYWVSNKVGTKARYIQLKVFVNGSWAFFNEVEVYGTSTVATKIIDVVAGKTPTLSGSGTSDYNGNITDGDASSDIYDKTWLGLNDKNKVGGDDVFANYVNATFKLDKEYVIAGASLTYGIDTGAGIGRAYDVTLQVSDDGKTWTSIGNFDASKAETGIYTVQLTDVKATKAKYVRLNALNGGWFFVGELNVYSEVLATDKGDAVTDSGIPNTGDATDIAMFAAIALVAIAGSAIVIKGRR